MKLNHNILKERIDELSELNIYLPLVLYTYVGVDYLDELPEQEKQKYYKHRVELMGAEDYNKYLEGEVLEFIKEYPQFQNIIE